MKRKGERAAAGMPRGTFGDPGFCGVCGEEKLPRESPRYCPRCAPGFYEQAGTGSPAVYYPEACKVPEDISISDLLPVEERPAADSLTLATVFGLDDPNDFEAPANDTGAEETSAPPHEP